MSEVAKKISSTIHDIERVTVRFAGDSGDGMQLTGSLFTDESAIFGNDLATFPDFPAEIRAPIGTVAGVSSFQVQIGSVQIATPGDAADALVAMNPAALKANLQQVRRGALIIINIDTWKETDLAKAGYAVDPLTDGSLDEFQIIRAPITTLTREALKDIEIEMKSKDRCKNMFALGMVFWLYNRDCKNTEKYIRDTFGARKPLLASANLRVLRTGHDFAATLEEFASAYRVAPAKIAPGVYRQITGNQATAYGMIAAAVKSGHDLVLGSYPITPASDILHELAKHKEFNVRTVQAEDEIAGVCVAIGASYAGALGCTTTSGPGLDLKAEAIGLAVAVELPLVVIDIQRGGPSTGLPTKTEQSDLLLALHGRHGESPLPVIAASTPSNCFNYVYEAARIALEHMTPVILLADGYLANGSEPWLIPNTDDLPPIYSRVVKVKEGDKFLPFKRDEKTLVRGWALPGTPGLEHRIGGLEKQDVTGNVSYDPANHERMTYLRAEKVACIADRLPAQIIEGDAGAALLVVGWGSTYGALSTAVRELNEEGCKVAHIHINYLNPLPKNVGEILHRYKKIVVCELNTGQLFSHLRALFGLEHITRYNKVQGLPFAVSELKSHLLTLS